MAHSVQIILVSPLVSILAILATERSKQISGSAGPELHVAES